MCDSLNNRLILINCVSIILLFLSIGTSKADRACTKHTSTEECCTGFRKIKGECTECIGFIGISCGHPCEPGWYGPQCKLFCSCMETEICNQFVGCISASRNTSIFTTGPSIVDKEECSLQELLDTCIIWQLAVGLIGIQVLALIALMGYSVRRKMKWKRNLEIHVTETAGHFRIKKDDSISYETSENKERNFVNYDSHFLRGKKTNGETGDIYNHIHFKRVTKVQNSSDKYDVILKQYQRRKDHVTESPDQGGGGTQLSIAHEKCRKSRDL